MVEIFKKSTSYIDQIKKIDEIIKEIVDPSQPVNLCYIGEKYLLKASILEENSSKLIKNDQEIVNCYFSAIDKFKKAIESDNDPIFYNLLGITYLELSKYELPSVNIKKAENNFTQAFKINPATTPYKWTYQESLNQDANESIIDQTPQNNSKRCSLLSIFTKLFPKPDNPDKQKSLGPKIEPTSPKEQIVFDGQVREKYISAYYLSEIYKKYFSENKPPIYQNVKKQLEYFKICQTLDPTGIVYGNIPKKINFRLK